MNIKITGRGLILVLWDVLATYIAFSLTVISLQQSADLFVDYHFLLRFGLLAAVNIVIFTGFRLYNAMWEYAGLNEIKQLIFATIASSFVGILVQYIAQVQLSVAAYFIAFILYLFLVTGSRFAIRFAYQGRRTVQRRPPIASRPRTLIIGAGETGSLVIRRMTGGDFAMQGLPIACVDDDPKKFGLRINDIKVIGTTDDIELIVSDLEIVQIVVAIPSASAAERKRIFNICIKTRCRLMTLPNVRDLRIDELDDMRLREVDLSDLLSRDEVKLNTSLVSSYLTGKRVLITGGGGSIGSELARQVATVAPSQIIIFDIYENTAADLAFELTALYSDIKICVEIGSIRDEACLEALFAHYRPDVVFHAAAHKHVPLMETNPREAVLNNVFGTLNIVSCADKYKVSNFIFISTDKAVNPSSVMGATKRLGEMIVQYFASNSQTVFTAVRFGNVLGSHGSVVPRFKEQIASGGPLTITHPDMTRYFMTIPESARLVVQAGGMAQGGEIFILDMGEPVRILDLAHDLISISGLTPNIDIMIEYIGLRPGEKLHEELLMCCEQTLPTDLKGIMISTGEPVAHADVAAKLDALRDALASTTTNIKLTLQNLVETYRPPCPTSEPDLSDKPIGGAK